MRFTRKSILFLLCLIVSTFSMVPVFAETPQELADPDGQFLDIDGVSIYIQARGDAVDPAVILLHGFGGSTFTWRGTLDPLVEAGYYVIAMDLPPFGLSDKSAELDYSRTALANLVVNVMDELEIDQAVIVGHSMGGGVTAYLGAQHPERVRGLIFVSGGLFEAMPEDAAQTQTDTSSRDGLFGMLEGIDPSSPLAGMLVRTFLTPQRFTDLLESAYVRKDVITPEVIAGYQRPLKTDDWPEGLLAFSAAEEKTPISLDDLTTAVEENGIPVLILWGESDPWVSIALGETMHEALINSEMKTYEGIGHLLMEEDTDAFNVDVIAFLQTLNG
jgi:pimeloyl-ACP methyl ester carboxylesterase